MTHRKLILSVGFAMFAMFFGAGNLVFPLSVGAHAGNHLSAALLGFTLTGVIVPFLGLFAITLYHGDYQEFLAVIGKRAGMVVASILILVIGFVVGTPRCSVLAFNTIAPFMPHSSIAAYIFNAVFFALIYVACVKKNKVVDLLGYILSPLKLSLLVIVIIAGFIIHGVPMRATTDAKVVLWHAMLSGYGTMDLLAGFFFCTFIYRFIVYKTQHSDITDKTRQQLVLKSCLIGAALLAVIYLCFIVVADKHAQVLQEIPTQAMIGVIAKALLN